MPEYPPPKHTPHPLHAGGPTQMPAAGSLEEPRCASPSAHPFRLPRPVRWGELLVQSNHTFLGGASHPEELVAEAARLGHAGIALADVETVGGAVRAHVAARDQIAMAEGRSMRLAQGARMSLAIDPPAAVTGHAGQRAGIGEDAEACPDRITLALLSLIHI